MSVEDLAAAKLKQYAAEKFRDEIPEKERKKMTPKVQEQYFFWDGIFKRLIQLYPHLILAIIRVIFGKKYPKGTKIELIATEYLTKRGIKNGDYILRNIRADILIQVGDDIYHFECQIRDDGIIIIPRMMEYDTQAALAHKMYHEAEDGILDFYMPHSAVVYLTGTRNTPDARLCRVHYPEGSTVLYRIRSIKVQDYSPETVEKEKLYLFIPFLPLRLKNVLKRKNGKELARKELTELLNKCNIILRRANENGNLSDEEVRDLTDFTLKACEWIFADKEYEDIVKEAQRIMAPIVKLDREIIAEQREQLETQGRQLETQERQLETKEKQLKAQGKQLKVKDKQLQTGIQSMLAIFCEGKLSVELMGERLSAAFAMPLNEANKMAAAYCREHGI